VSWQDLIETGADRRILPWIGGSVRHDSQVWALQHRPREHGWYRFELKGRKALSWQVELPDNEVLKDRQRGYLVGNRLVPDGVEVSTDPANIAASAEQVYLLADDLDRFARVVAGRAWDEGPLIFVEEDFPLGPETDVLHAFEDRFDSLQTVAGVTPGLEAAWRMEVWRRAEADKRRAELAEQLRLEAEAVLLEARRREIRNTLGDGAGRRELALQDFEAGARAALTVAGAEYLSHRKAGRRNEYIVKYRLAGSRYECTCDRALHIIDAGICLQDHDTGVKGDTRFTLESLPAVVREADRTGKLVVWRHG